MPNKEIYTAESPISVKMLNGFVQDGQIEHQNEGEIWLLSKEKIQNLLTTKTDKTYFTKFIFNESVTTPDSGYTYYGCTISGSIIGAGPFYFYNCSGTLSVNYANAKVYATNCPKLNINSNYTATVFRDGVGLLYDKDSSYNSLNWGYPSGIKNVNGTIFKDFSAYRYLIIGAVLSERTTQFLRVGHSGTLCAISGSGNYVGWMDIIINTNNLIVQAAREWTVFAGTTATVDNYDNYSSYYIEKIWGVL